MILANPSKVPNEQPEADSASTETAEITANQTSAPHHDPVAALRSLLHSPLPSAQRRQVVQNFSQRYGNRQLQRLLNSLPGNPPRPDQAGLKLSGISQDENIGGYSPSSPSEATLERVCQCGGQCPTCSGSNSNTDENATSAEQGGLVQSRSASDPAVERFLNGFFSGTIGGPVLQRTIGDGHDLTSPRFSGDSVLEACFDNERTLRRGNNGPAVEKIQQALLDLGFTLPAHGADGKFGAETERAVRSFQRNSLLPASERDGVIGPVTMGHFDQRFGTAVPAAPGPVTVTENTVTPPTHNPAGEFNWEIGWNTNGRDGFIVQELTNTMNVQRCNGTNVTNTGIDPHYWEAWRVNSSGQVRPNLGAVNDVWFRVRRPGTRGNWTMNARVFFVTSLDPAANFVAGAVGNAGDLQSTTTQPGNLGTSLLTRHAGGTWDNCNGNNTHTPA